MPFSIIRQDLTTMRVDAIVNATDRFYSGGGGVDRAIHEAAGAELSEACGYLGRLHLGEVKATSGYHLQAKHVFHTSGPRWTGGSDRELTLLGDCYRNSIALARNKSCRTLAFPLISSKGKHFPKEVALTVAINAIRDSLAEHDDLDVYLVLYDEHTRTTSENLFPEIQKIIEQEYRPSTTYIESITRVQPARHAIVPFPIQEPVIGDAEHLVQTSTRTSVDIEQLLEELLNHPTQKNLDKIPVDESFAQMLARLLNLPSCVSTNPTTTRIASAAA